MDQLQRRFNYAIDRFSPWRRDIYRFRLCHRHYLSQPVVFTLIQTQDSSTCARHRQLSRSVNHRRLLPSSRFLQYDCQGKSGPLFMWRLAKNDESALKSLYLILPHQLWLTNQPYYSGYCRIIKSTRQEIRTSCESRIWSTRRS